MAKNLVVVESPAKAKTINKYLGKDFIVKASIGHIKDLPSKGLGVDVQNNFAPEYEIIPDTKKRNNKKIVADLKKTAKEVDTIYLAADPDREGEAICQHLAEAFVKTEYWTIAANLTGNQPPPFDARLLRVGEQTVKTSGFDQDLKKTEILIGKDELANEIVAEARQQIFVVDEVTTKERKRNPVPPFITSKLQQEAARKLGFAVKRTMMIAQHLYEGVEIGAEGSVGLITYMRTDSTRVGEAALGEVRGFINQQYGANYLPEKAVHYRSKKDAQDAHEAIRPTEVSRTPDSLAQYLKPEELKLYRLIWQRYVASQMMPALFDQTTIDIKAGRLVFRATGSVQKIDGFLKIYQEGRDEKAADDEEAERTLPLVQKGETLALNNIDPEQHFTEPPPRYTEATLVKVLEEKGIGRPSTYAAIMTTIQDREYVEKKEGRFHPTALGKTVNDVLIEGGFDDLFNETYTARMEEELDEIEEGKLKWTDALSEFYDKFKDDLSKFQKYAKDIKEKETPTEEVCLKCGTPGMVQKLGRFGKYLKCLNCSATRDAEPVATNEVPTTANASADGEEEIEA